MNIILFDRDLRIFDHQPIAEAAKIGEVLPLYIIEPSQWEDAAYSVRHFQFVVESLEDLSHQIEKRGGKLFFSINKMCDVFEKLMEAYESINVFIHRNSRILKKVIEWMGRNQQRLFIYGAEIDQVSARGVKKQVQSYLDEPLIQAPDEIQVPEETPSILFTDMKKIHHFHVKGQRIRFGQQGGESRAIETLESFLEERCANYIVNQHKPLPSSFSSSRLSAYISWGNISVRTILQKTSEKLQLCENDDEKLQLEAFLSKLTSMMRTVCHPPEDKQIEEVSRIKKDWNEEWFQRWIEGMTGVPVIDAAMRSLVKTGWLNYTLREMVTSFIANTLLLDGQKPSAVLAQLYLDYDPALHDFYVQQITGLRTKKVKIANPVKISKQIDPEGGFIRRYISELETIPVEYVHEPWLYPAFYQLGYPPPMIDVVKANKLARQRFDSLTKQNKPSGKNGEGETGQLSFDI
ncbi:FAD-binding domain-containing protein [Cytobacillus oceanisediminis]|uniref:FAD-binding domain-containing protein n=1 Tax=Cytobacillus oceanisediminis TaxID=665099 RepID=UPI0011AAB981|nr:FAD-binding domain-containing protein [Cytobacillus oceanisediminis]